MIIIIWIVENLQLSFFLISVLDFLVCILSACAAFTSI